MEKGSFLHRYQRLFQFPKKAFHLKANKLAAHWQNSSSQQQLQGGTMRDEKQGVEKEMKVKKIQEGGEDQG